MRPGPDLVATIALATLLVPPASGQAVAPVRELDPAREIALARSAAPASVSENATIWSWSGDRYLVVVEGTNGNACMVGRSRPGSLEPICYDREGARTLLEIEQRRASLRVAGFEGEALDARLDGLIADGVLEAPSRPSLAWMLSSGQELVADDGRPVGAWKPHLMLYWPYLAADDLGLAGGSPDAFVDNEGEPLAVLITIAPAFVDPEAR